jgi:hypothetical protein
MVMPWLKKEADVAIPVESHKLRKPDDGEFNGLHACMDEFIAAVHAKDIKGAAEAFKSAFQVCESEPHEESPHEDIE